MTRSAKGTIESPGKQVKQKSGLNKSINDAAWNQLLQFMAYKAKDADRTIIGVNPRHTSQICSHCKYVSKENRKTQEKFQCRQCGYLENADINAARNILEADRALQGEKDLPISICGGSK